MSTSDDGVPSDQSTLRHLAERLLQHVEALEGHVAHGGKEVADRTEQAVVPAWRAVTEGETRWPVALAICLVITLQLALPSDLTLGGRWLIPGLELVLLVGLMVANPSRLNRREPALRAVGIVLIAVVSVANAVSAARLVRQIVDGGGDEAATVVLGTGASVWVTNVIVFALWYWELDRGGPAARASEPREFPDFLFPQMTTPSMAPADWEPYFVDYLYVSFTNATAFSPTDTMPMARWAKLTMLLQSAVSLVTVGLVIARAVNILK